MLIIGDVHGKIKSYSQIIQGEKSSICVGDFGFKREWEWAKKNLLGKNHWINMGNHDYLPFLNELPSTGNCKYFEELRLFTVRGADSIDKHFRTENLDWFSNEEMNYQECQQVIDVYLEYKPEIVVSHDCPQSVMEQLFPYTDKSITRNLLQSMFEEHQPLLWLFGHHHKSIKEKTNGTEFVCLNELETFNLK